MFPGLPGSKLQSWASALYTVLQSLLHPGPGYPKVPMNQRAKLEPGFFMGKSSLLEGEKEIVCVRPSV